MKMLKYLTDIHKLLAKDENLLRLLYYKPKSFDDDPLSPLKPNIIGSDKEKSIVASSIVRSHKTTDLSLDNKICRLCVYPGQRDNKAYKTSRLAADQDIVIDIYANIEAFDNIDFRLAKICDYVDERFFDQPITGIGKMDFQAGRLINTSPEGHFGYRLFYSFTSMKG